MPAGGLRIQSRLILRFRWRLEYEALRGLIVLLSLLPWRACQGLGRGIGKTLRWLILGRDRLAVQNLARSFPDKSPAEIRSIANDAWSNFGQVMVEIGKLASLSREELLRHSDFINPEEADRAVREGKGVLIHSAHLANWESQLFAAGTRGYPVTAIVRRIKNPYIQILITELRNRFNIEVILTRNAPRGCLDALRRKRFVAIMMDQNTPDGGLFIPFFGRPAATTTLTALLAIKTGAPILALQSKREGDRILGTFKRVPIADEGPLEEQMPALVRRLSGVLEDFIRERPSEWLWFHNRWKRQPEPPVS